MGAYENSTRCLQKPMRRLGQAEDVGFLLPGPIRHSAAMKDSNAQYIPCSQPFLVAIDTSTIATEWLLIAIGRVRIPWVKSILSLRVLYGVSSLKLKFALALHAKDTGGGLLGPHFTTWGMAMALAMAPYGHGFWLWGSGFFGCNKTQTPSPSRSASGRTGELRSRSSTRLFCRSVC